MTEEDVKEEIKKKVLLIYPPSPVLNREDRCQQPTKDLIVIPPLPPTDLMYLASISEQAGCEAMIRDYSQGGNFVSDLKTYSPDYIVINVAMPTLEHDLDAVRIAKEICPDIITIAKGAAFLTMANEILANHKSLDIAILGEAEETLREILEGNSREEIKGIYYREDLVIRFTGVRPFIDNLDTLPFPARHLVNNNMYRRPDNGKVQAVIKVSRGCPFHSAICHVPFRFAGVTSNVGITGSSSSLHDEKQQTRANKAISLNIFFMSVFIFYCYPILSHSHLSCGQKAARPVRLPQPEKRTTLLFPAGVKLSPPLSRCRPRFPDEALPVPYGTWHTPESSEPTGAAVCPRCSRTRCVPSPSHPIPAVSPPLSASAGAYP